MDRLLKNKQLSKSRLLTIEHHKPMVCKTYELKVDKSHLSNETLGALRRLFLEAKWFYNDLIAKGDVFRADYKITVVAVMNREKKFEMRELQFLSSQMRQEIIDRAKDSIRGLARLKKNGRKVGGLRFKSIVRSIPLKQYGVTYRIREDRVLIQCIRQPMRLRGLDQIPKGAEFVNATLEQRTGDYYLHVTTYQDLVEDPIPMKAIGVDAGIKHQLTLSNGLQIDESVPITKRVRRLHNQLSRRELHSKNWFKTNLRLNREYGHLSNLRVDIRQKLVSKLVSTYESVAIQNDNVAGWQKMWGRRVTASAIGGIMSDLKIKPRTPFIVGRSEPTTKKCGDCGTMNDIGLEERVYRCSKCGFSIDRDLNAAINDWKTVPAERREFTPVDTKAATELMGYFNSIPNVSASLVAEAGSHRFQPW
jgi:putative transposase